jgi:hypothetical protein
MSGDSEVMARKVRKWYLGQTAALWAFVVAFMSGAIVGVLITIDRGEPGYLIGVAGMLLIAFLIAYVTMNYAAIVTMDEVGFSAVTVGLRRRGWPWAETTAEHQEYRSSGPVVSLRRDNQKQKVYLRRTMGSYDEAMRFAIDHAARRVSFQAAVEERQSRTTARRRDKS